MSEPKANVTVRDTDSYTYVTNESQVDMLVGENEEGIERFGGVRLGPGQTARLPPGIYCAVAAPTEMQLLLTRSV